LLLSPASHASGPYSPEQRNSRRYWGLDIPGGSAAGSAVSLWLTGGATQPPLRRLRRRSPRSGGM